MTATWALAALWLGLALAATMLSIWLRVATALSEIVVGAIAQLLIGAFVSEAAPRPTTGLVHALDRGAGDRRPQPLVWRNR